MGPVVVSKVNMMVFQKMGALAMNAALGMALVCIVPAANGQATKLTQPTAAQMQAIQKALAGQASQGKTATQIQGLLPEKFGGWVRGGVDAATQEPAKPEPGDAAALKEFGLERGEQAEYRRGGERVAVRVLEFQDATGAYGEFTMLRAQEASSLHGQDMQALRVGPQQEAAVAAVSKKSNAAVKSAGKPVKMMPVAPPLTFTNGARAGEHFLFWKGDLLVDAKFEQPVSDALGAITDLEKALPQTAGPRGLAPILPEQLPREGLDAGSVTYAIGPAAYVREGGVVPASVMDFGADAEVVTARYGGGTLTVISYPTPEIAQARASAMASVLKSGVVPGPKDGERVKRAGPLVAMTSGNLSAAEADALLKKVQFEGTVAIDQLKPQESKAERAAKLLFGIATLIIIIGGTSLLLGFFLGGGRAAYRVMRGLPASSVTDNTFIILGLDRPTVVREEAEREETEREETARDRTASG